MNNQPAPFIADRRPHPRPQTARRFVIETLGVSALIIVAPWVAVAIACYLF